MSDILRWVCDTYRRKLMSVNPAACREVDLVMVRAGQNWVCDETVIDPDELVTAAQIEERYGLKPFTVRALARRYGIEVRGLLGNRNVYRLGDILSARAAKKSSN